MCIALHPFLIGVPHRIRYLDKALQYIASHGKIWFATGHEIIRTYRAQETKYRDRQGVAAEERPMLLTDRRRLILAAASAAALASGAGQSNRAKPQAPYRQLEDRLVDQCRCGREDRDLYA